MATIINCEQCGEERRAAYKNTKLCIKCALLRDINFVGDRLFTCRQCDEKYAPVALRDPECGGCSIGCGKYLPCTMCGIDPDFSDEDGYYELHRAGVPLCVRCVRDPAKRQRLIRMLRKGQAQRAEANGLGGQQRRTAAPQPRRPAAAVFAEYPFDMPSNGFMIDLKRTHPKKQGTPNHVYLTGLLEAGVLVLNDRTLALKEAS